MKNQSPVTLKQHLPFFCVEVLSVFLAQNVSLSLLFLTGARGRYRPPRSRDLTACEMREGERGSEACVCKETRV